tara:strand:- start:366 stop:587 length:222 start_codon:yes stop_codon:yes gene_type:complete
MLPKLDEYGKAVSGSKGAKQERKSIDTFQEYYIEDVESIDEITNHFAINAKKFDTNKFTKALASTPSIAAVVD